jgi:glycerate-2-kinase
MISIETSLEMMDIAGGQVPEDRVELGWLTFDGRSLVDKLAVNSELLGSGANVRDTNTIRCHLSSI